MTHRVYWFLQEYDGGYVKFGLLRSLDWQCAAGLWKIGDTATFSMEEFGVVGDAQLMQIDACPEIEMGLGRIGTGWFEHSSGQLWELWIEGSEQPIRGTERHPIWSNDRLDWIPLNELNEGESVQVQGGYAKVQHIQETEDVEKVYTIEVDADHCYRVGEQGLLAHNFSAINIALGTYDRLKEFAEKHDAKYFLCWMKEDFGVPAAQQWDPNDTSGGTSSLFAVALRTAIANSKKIFFKLDGFEIIEWYPRSLQAGESFPRGSITAWELTQLFSGSYLSRRPFMAFFSGAKEMTFTEFRTFAIMRFETTAKQEKADSPDWKTQRPRPLAIRTLGGMFDYEDSQIELL